jgi:hypothetical protein
MLPNRFNFGDRDARRPSARPAWLTRYVLLGFIGFIAATTELVAQTWFRH